jgi:hypothetical protein
MLELLNQLDGFDTRGDVKVCAYKRDRVGVPRLYASPTQAAWPAVCIRSASRGD